MPGFDHRLQLVLPHMELEPSERMTIWIATSSTANHGPVPVITSITTTVRFLKCPEYYTLNTITYYYYRLEDGQGQFQMPEIGHFTSCVVPDPWDRPVGPCPESELPTTRVQKPAGSSARLASWHTQLHHLTGKLQPP